MDVFFVNSSGLVSCTSRTNYYTSQANYYSLPEIFAILIFFPGSFDFFRNIDDICYITRPVWQKKLITGKYPNPGKQTIMRSKPNAVAVW